MYCIWLLFIKQKWGHHSYTIKQLLRPYALHADSFIIHFFICFDVLGFVFGIMSYSIIISSLTVYCIEQLIVDGITQTSQQLD